MVHAQTFRDLILKYEGQRICIMGGAPSLAADLERVRADVWISANDHGARLRPVDYVVAMDNIHTEKKYKMVPHIRQFTDAPIIGPWPENDIFLTNWPGCPRKTFSGLVAAWCAWAMGAHPVILAGFDNYKATGVLGGRAKRKTKMFADYIQGPVRVVGGTMGGIWPDYRPRERFGAYEPHSSIRGLLGIDEVVTIEVRKPTTVRGQAWPKGTRLEVGRHEVLKLLKHRMVVEV